MPVQIRPNRKLPAASPRGLLLSLVLAAAFPAQATNDLTALSLEQLLELKVVGASKYEQKQSEVAAAVSIITSDEIRAFGWRTLEEALASLPGVHTTFDRQYLYLGTRGFGLPGDYVTRVLVTVNGNRTNDPVFDGGPMWRQLPLDMDLIERIEFIPGPGGAVYGQNAMFGVVNIVTRPGADMNGAELALHMQQPQRLREGRASWGRKFESGVELLLSASALRAAGQNLFFDYGAAGVSGLANGLDGDRDQEFFARATYGGWSFEFIYGDHRKDDPTGAYLSDPLVAGQFQGDRYALAQAQYERGLLGDTLQLQARLFAGQERFSSQLSYGATYAFPATGEWLGGELRLLYTGLAGHKLLFGVELQDDTRLDQSILDLSDAANDVLIQKSGSRSGLYLQDEWRVADSLTATLGLRIDKNSTTGTESSPRAAVIWQAAPTTTLKALYGRAHRAPNAYERDYDDGLSQLANPALQGETIDTLELVADHRVGSDLNLRGAVYQWTMRNIITLGLDPVSGIPQYQSGDRVKAYGLELSADKTWQGGARVRGSLTSQHVRDASNGKLLNSPDWLAKLAFSAPMPVAGLRLAYEFQYDSRRLTLDGSTVGGFALSHLRLSTAQLAPGLEIGLGVRNLFDKRYAHPGADTNWQNAIEQDGRSLRLDLHYRF